MHFFDFSYRNIWLYEKFVVILQAFSRERVRGSGNNSYKLNKKLTKQNAYNSTIS